MSLESATYINQLDAANPLGSDPIASGDDHIRLIKSTVKATFPNITGAVTKTHTAINNIPDNTSQALVDLQAYVDTAITNARQNAYPVGSVYVNATNSTNPATLLGFGTWVSFGAGRVPVGYDASNSNFNAAEKTGGSADAIVVAHTHLATSTVTDPGHNHTYSNSNFASGVTSGYAYSGNTYNSDNAVNSNVTGISVSTSIASSGTSGTNANLQPYITVYMWKRTA
jgi:hypothetical protein